DIESPETASEPSANPPPTIGRVGSFNLSGGSVNNSSAPSLELEYFYDNGEPVEDINYEVIDNEGAVHTGTLQSGLATLAGLPLGMCEIYYHGANDADEQTLIIKRKEFKQFLNKMLAEVKQKATIEDALFEQQSFFTQWAIETGARTTGFYQGGKSLVSGIADLVVLAVDINIAVYSACFELIDSLVRGDTLAVKQQLETILAYSEKSKTSLTQAFELLVIIIEDVETRDALASFPFDYIEAHSHVEKKRITGLFYFEVLLAVLTGGAGAAASIPSKSKHVTKVNKSLVEIAEILKRKRLNRQKTHTLDNGNPKTIDSIEKPATELTPQVSRVQTTRLSRVDNARALIDDLPADIRGNYYAYTRADGQVIITRKNAKLPPKLRLENGALVPVSDKIDIFNTIKQKLQINHVDLPLADQQKLTNLETLRNKSVAARDKALLIKDATSRKKALTAAQTAMRKASEELGEAAGEIYVKQNYPGATKLKASLLNNSKQGQFDQIYKAKDDTLIFIEAKGGNASWGSRSTGELQAQQGSKDYMQSIIDNYQKVYDDALVNPKIDKSSADFLRLEKTIEALEDAKDLDAFEYIGVKQKATDAGINNAIDIFKFEI
ncbi:MAG: type IV secretion protein Rhs, partial [Alteromonadales bacterium]|nr:type IV secretion protein Rhs [Alteromonadales bacterium]